MLQALPKNKSQPIVQYLITSLGIFFNPHDAFCISEEGLNLPRGLERKFSLSCFGTIIFIFYLSPTSSHPHALQGENCDSNSRLVVDEDDYRLERVNWITQFGCYWSTIQMRRFNSFIYSIGMCC